MSVAFYRLRSLWTFCLFMKTSFHSLWQCCEFIWIKSEASSTCLFRVLIFDTMSWHTFSCFSSFNSELTILVSRCFFSCTEPTPRLKLLKSMLSSSKLKASCLVFVFLKMSWEVLNYVLIRKRHPYTLWQVMYSHSELGVTSLRCCCVGGN